MKEIKLPYIAIAFNLLLMLLFTACEEMDTGKERSSDPADFALQISSPHYSAEWSEGTRSLDAVDDDLQKMIHNLYYYFYDDDGFIEYIFHQNINSTRVHTVKFEEFAKAAQDRNVDWYNPHGSLYIVANMDNKQNDLTAEEQKPQIILSTADRADYDKWITTVKSEYDFKYNAIMPLYISGPNSPQPDNKDLGLPGHMIMFGHFDGTFHYDEVSGTSDHTMSIVLGRAVARLRVALSGAGLGPQARITIENAPIVTSLFPGVRPLLEDSDSLDCWHNYVEMISTGTGKGITGSAGNYSGSTIYYCGENSTQDYPIKSLGSVNGVRPTKLIVDTWDAVADRTATERGTRRYTVVLGHDVPHIPGTTTTTTTRDLNLYRNTSYTFNITLNPTKAAEAATKADKTYTDPAGQIHLWPEK